MLNGLSYNEAKALFETAKDKTKGKPLEGTATRLVQTAKGYGIKYHNTIIVEIMPNDIYRLNNDGFYTVTTKRKMNEYSPFQVYQVNHVWYITLNGIKTKYVNNMIIHSPIDGHTIVGIPA